MPAKKAAPQSVPTAAQKRAARASLQAVEKAQKELDLRLKEHHRHLKVMSIFKGGGGG